MSLGRRMHDLRRLLLTVAGWARDGWLIVGVALLLFLALEVAYRGQASVRRLVGGGGGDAVPREHPYRDSLWYYEYRDEYERSTRLAWRPYVYYRRLPFEGRTINIDSAQHRVTVHPASVPADAPQVFFFGGSTMWGDYQRDAFTIPSAVVSRLAARGHLVRATNFGESGHVTTQGVLELLLQLRSGARPAAVVFYDGINDVAAAVQSGAAGMPQNEYNRAAEFRLGQSVRGWQEGYGLMPDLRALGLLTVTATERSQLLQRLGAAVASEPEAAEPDTDALALQVVDTYSETLRILEALSAHYGFEWFYVWQPNPHVSVKPHTEFERRIHLSLQDDPFQRQLGEVHRRVRDRLPNVLEPPLRDRFLDLSRALDDYAGPAWVDQIGHTTEAAAVIVAGPIADHLEQTLW